LHALCRTHHRLKTYAGWQVRRDGEGVDHWRSPTGRYYTDQPPTPPWPTLGKPMPGSSTSQAYRVSRVHVTLPANWFPHTHPRNCVQTSVPDHPTLGDPTQHVSIRTHSPATPINGPPHPQLRDSGGSASSEAG
jgi:hypothetical protein